MKKNILLGVTASIAAYKACEIIGLLRKKGYGVRCVMSPDAEKFVTELTLETLTRQKVVTGLFRGTGGMNPVHISLAEEADLILIAPATADIIGKIASGIVDDALTCTVCASDGPVLFAPAMNDKMFANPIVQGNIESLRGYGYHFVGPAEGRLACDKQGKGHLAPLEKVVEKAEQLLSK
ncbi:MAG: phosphopantothenoylcysteine decarboxylase [Candidatus Omnitrophica bacterium]|nr:phosphopantothenoylcysteine decarboxylase [Candidatus Omnitrophota bacterium]